MFKKKSLSILFSCLTSSLVTSSIVVPTIYFDRSSINQINKYTNSEIPIVANNNQVSLLYSSNRNSNYESPNGILQKVNVNNNISFTFVSYFNNVSWTYNLVTPTGQTNKSILSSQTDFESLKSAEAKYNKYSNTYFIFGTYVSKTKTNVAFLFQIFADSGQEVIINNSNTTSLWVEKEKVREIEDITINGEESSVFVVPKYDYWENTITDTMFYKVNFEAYSSTRIQLFSLGTLNKPIGDNKDINKYKIGSIFDLGDSGRWGITFLDVSDASKLKYKYLLFDRNLSLKAASDTWQEKSVNPTNSAVLGKNYGVSSIMDPIFFKSSNSQLYTMIDTNVNPIFDSNYNGVAAIGSNTLRKSTFTWNDATTFTINSSVPELELKFSNVPYYIYQVKKDDRNNLIYLSLYSKSNATSQSGPQINWSSVYTFMYSIDPNTSNLVAQGTTLNTYTYTNKKAVMNFSIINDYRINGVNPINASNNSHMVKEILAYDLNQKLTLSSSFSYVSQKKSSATNTNGTWSKGIDSEWGSFNKTDYNTGANSYKNKLPSDIDENTIKSWVSYANNTTQLDASQYTNALEKLNPTSDYYLSSDSNILFNNNNGTLKARVKSEIKKWWYQNPTSESLKGYDILVDYTDIELNGFATVDSLMFSLITNSLIEPNKWEKITQEYFGKKMPSAVTVNDILNDFVVFGNGINLTTNDIALLSVGTAINASKAINVIYDDTNGTLTIQYDMSSKSSPSIDANALRGSYSYTGFLKTSSFTQISFDTAKFDALKKTKLAYQFTINDLLKVVKVSDGYSLDPTNWTLSYKDEFNSTAYNNNLINGQTSFTLTYKRLPIIPDSVSNDKLKITVDANSNGMGCKKLEDYIGGQKVNSNSDMDFKKSGLYFDQKLADSLTGLDDIDSLKIKLNNLLLQTLSVNLNWFDISLFKPIFNEKLSVDNKAVFDLILDNNITTNIMLTKDGIKQEKLVLTPKLQELLKTNRPNMLKINFSDKLQVTFNYQSATYNWNYDIPSQVGSNSTTIDIESLVDKVNTNRLGNKMQLLNVEYNSASGFVDKYKNNFELFNKEFNLISANGLNLNTNISQDDPSYFEISSINMIPNDQNGTVLVQYKLFYPNLTSSIEVTTSPEIMITGFPSSSVTTTILIVVAVIILILLIALSIWLSVYINTKRKKTLYKNDNKVAKKSYFDLYCKKVVKKS